MRATGDFVAVARWERRGVGSLAAQDFSQRFSA